ncbi:MAG: hypothetical protein WCG25_06320 [bacterium]
MYSSLSCSSVSSETLSLCTSVHISDITALSSKSCDSITGSGVGVGIGGIITSSKFINFRKSSLDT